MWVPWKTSSGGTDYRIGTAERMDRQLEKLQARSPVQYAALANKVRQIAVNPHRFKNLRAPMQHLKRAHIDSHFVLIFYINEAKKEVWLEGFDHHDKIYGN
jgi:YafQ family addiction module toxin component